VDNKDILDREGTKTSSSSSGRLPSKELKKQTGRQTVGTSKKNLGKKVSAKKKPKDKAVRSGDK
jgi:hypothetical protein